MAEMRKAADAPVGGGADLGMVVENRSLLVRYDRRARNYPGLLQLAFGLLWYRGWLCG